VTLANAKKNSQSVVPCALGIRVHSGWGALVALSGKRGAEQVEDRRYIEIIDPQVPGAAQPYHFAEKLEIRTAEKHIAKCAAMANRLAAEGLRELSNALRDRGCHLNGAAILLSSGRPLPDLPGILASHAMIHAAEGDFFRQAFREACQSLNISVIGIREKELDHRATLAFGKRVSAMRQRVSEFGRSLGPPWTTDEKTAALAAAIVLAGPIGVFPRSPAPGT
jgi:hypothetical protein